MRILHIDARILHIRWEHRTVLNFGEKLRQAREQAGLTQAEFGELIGYSRTAISRMESSSDPRLTPRVLSRISEVLQTPTASLLSDREDPVNRRQLLQATVVGAAIVATSRAAPGAVGTKDVAEISTAIEDLRRMDQLTGGERLTYFADRLVADAEHLLTGRLTTQIADQLQTVHGKAAVLAGWLAQDSGKLQHADRHYSTALTAAQLGGNAALSVEACAFMAFLALKNRASTRAIQCAQAGQRAALQCHSGPRTRALLAAREAIARGQLGDVDGIDDATTRTWRAFDSRRGVDDPWTDFVSAAELTGMLGQANSLAGRHEAGLRALRDAAQMSSIDRPRNAASWRAFLAITYIHAGNPAQAAEVAAAVLPAVQTLSSARLRSDIQGITLLLRPHTRIVEVRRFTQQAAAAGFVA